MCSFFFFFFFYQSYSTASDKVDLIRNDRSSIIDDYCTSLWDSEATISRWSLITADKRYWLSLWFIMWTTFVRSLFQVYLWMSYIYICKKIEADSRTSSIVIDHYSFGCLIKNRKRREREKERENKCSYFYI